MVYYILYLTKYFVFTWVWIMIWYITCDILHNVLIFLKDLLRYGMICMQSSYFPPGFLSGCGWDALWPSWADQGPVLGRGGLWAALHGCRRAVQDGPPHGLSRWH